MINENTKVMVLWPDDDTDVFNIGAGYLNGNILSPYMFIVCQGYVIWTSMALIKENRFTLKKKVRNWRCRLKTLRIADSDDALALT